MRGLLRLSGIGIGDSVYHFDAERLDNGDIKILGMYRPTDTMPETVVFRNYEFTPYGGIARKGKARRTRIKVGTVIETDGAYLNTFPYYPREPEQRR